jgi:hypothetical protein
MAEYQYYEFLAIDRPLSQEEQEAVARRSSRVEPHPRRAVFTYNWGDFPGRAEDVLARYYDALLYLANWGTRQLMFRFPKAALDIGRMQPYIFSYEMGEYVSLSTVGEFVVLNIRFYQEGGWWIEQDVQLDTLVPLRDDLLRGDYRLLYLAWLKTLSFEDVLPTLLEPPVPPGLNKLSPALETFVELFDVDEVLLQVAAETSAVREPLPETWIERGLARLSRQECERYLLRLVRGEPHLSVALLSRLRELVGRPSGGAGVETPRRTVGYLLAEADRRWEEERRRRAEAVERKRLQELETLADRETEAWQEVEDLIEQRTGNAYDEAVQRLVRLRELAIHRGQEAAFARRTDQIRGQYSRRSGLLRRMRDAGLYPS